MFCIQRPFKTKTTIAYVVCIMVLLVGLTGTSRAVPYQDVVDWDDVVFLGRTCKVIDDKNWFFGDPYPFDYAHDVAFNPPAAHVNSAILTLSHWGNYSGPLNPELWIITTSSEEKLGQLNVSGWEHGWVDQPFQLPLSIYESISGESWSLGIMLEEGTGGCFDWDGLMLDKSVLTGDYTVPIPASLMLLGSGLVCVVALRRKFRG